MAEPPDGRTGSPDGRDVPPRPPATEPDPWGPPPPPPSYGQPGGPPPPAPPYGQPPAPQYGPPPGPQHPSQYGSPYGPPQAPQYGTPQAPPYGSPYGPPQGPPQGPPPSGPYGAPPPSWQGAPGPPGPPPHTRTHRKRRSATLPLLLGAALLVVLLVAGAATAVVLNNRGGTPKPQASKGKAVDAATAALRSATATFARQPAIRYTGQITTSADQEDTVDLNVTQEGTTTGRVIEKGSTLGLLIIDDKTFLHAPTAYWLAHDTEAKRAARYPKQWTRVSPQRLGIDPATLLAPDAMAAKFPKSAPSGKQSQGPLTTINGVETREVSGSDATVYVTTAEPYRIMRVKSTSDKFSLDIGYFAEPGVPVLFKSIDAQVQQLTLAIDSQVLHSVDGKILLSPCGQTSCTASATIDTVSTPYTETGKSTAADVQINFTLDSRPIGTCTKVLTLPPSGKAPTACKVNYRLPADGRRHTIEAVVLATARAVLGPDIAKLRQGVAGESLGWRLRQAGTTGLPGSTGSNGPFRFVPPAGYDPNTGPLQKTGGGYADADGNLWAEVAPKGLAAKRGFAKEWRVKLTAAGLLKWKGSAKKSKGDYYLSVTPDGNLSH